MSDNLILIDFGSITVYWYAVWAVISVCAAAFGFVTGRRLQKQSAASAWNIVLAAMPAALLAGHLFYCWFSNFFAAHRWWEWLVTWSGGFTFYGVLIGILMTLAVYSAVRKQPFPVLTDAAAVPVVLALGIMRFAGITAGQDMGIYVQQRNDGGLIFLRELEKGSWTLWVGFFEGITAVIVAAVCAVFFARTYLREKSGARQGDVTLCFMLMYGMPQSVFESMRNDSLYMVTLGFVKISEIISIVMATAAFVILVVRDFRRRRRVKFTAAVSFCYTVPLAVAVYCEFTMNAVDFARNYLMMSGSLGLMLALSMCLLIGIRPKKKAAGQPM